MKRAVTFFLLITIVGFCFYTFGFGKMKIEDYEWKMRTIAHIEDDQVVYDAVAENDDVHPSAAAIDMTLIAKDGKITIFDATNEMIYEGAYSVARKNPKGTDYRITMNEKSGHATVAMTMYASGMREPTLPIYLDGYSMHFYGKQ